MNIPPDVKIISTINPGSVYYFRDEAITSESPHYFVVRNKDTVNGPIVALLCASSQIEKRQKWYSSCPPETLVVVGPAQYRDFTKQTIINCNEVYKFTIAQLVTKLNGGILRLKAEMSISIVENLRWGILVSPVIERETKELLY